MTRRAQYLAARVAAFELRLQVRSPVFVIVVGIAALMVVGSLTVDRLQVGPLRPGNRTGTEAVLAVHLVWSLFFLFTAAAFAAEAALRDEAARFDAIVRSTPAPRAAIDAGRFGGATAAVLLSFVSVPAAILLARFAPWAGPLAPPDFRAVAFGTLILAAPNLVVATSIFYALAATVRSAMAAYLGAVALLILYGLGTGGTGSPTLLRALLDPFGFAAVEFATAMPGAPGLPAIGGVLAVNRLAWLTVAAGAILLSVRRRRWTPRTRPPNPTLIRAAPPSLLPRIKPRFDRTTFVAQLASRTRLELGRVLRSPFLPVLLLLGLANVVGSMASLPSNTSFADTLARVDEAFRLVPIVAATFWAGELVWSERDVGLDEIVGSSPAPNAALLLPKMLGLLLILGGSLSLPALAAAVLDGWRMGTVHPGPWLLGFAAPRIWDAALLAILAVFLQTVAPGKLAGFGLMVLYLISALALETMGFHGDLYRYGGASASLELGQAFSLRGILVRAYWSAAALLLMMVALRLAGRGAPTTFGERLRLAVSSIIREQGLAFLTLVITMLVLAIALTASPRSW